MQADLVYTSPNPCQHDEVYPYGCCDEPGHGPRVNICAACGVEV